MFMPPWPGNFPASNKFEEILKLLGNPEKKLPPIIHITGTNGKGSILSFIEAILKNHGLKIHKFTSPHLLEFNENFIVANEQVTDSILLENINEIKEKLEDKINPGFFEFQTALAFNLFSKYEADFCLIECGMGAKNDPTNFIPEKELAIISSISLDHQEFLGETIEEITFDKSHIIYNAKKTITAPQIEIVDDIIQGFAERLKQELCSYQINYDFDVEDDKFIYVDIDKKEILTFNLPALQGFHQLINLGVSIAAVKQLKTIEIKDELINKAILHSKWPGRLEKIENLPVEIANDNVEIWIDGAHNEGGALMLSEWLKNFQDDKENIIIYGRTAGNNHEEFLKYFKNSKIFALEVKNEPNSEDKFGFKNFKKTHPDYNLEIFSDLSEIFFEKISKLKQKTRLVICGSLYLYRDLETIRKKLKKS